MRPDPDGEGVTWGRTAQPDPDDPSYRTSEGQAEVKPMDEEGQGTGPGPVFGKDLIPFEYNGQRLTGIWDADGNPYVIGKEVFDIIEYANASDTIAKQCKHAIKDGIAKRDAMRKLQKYTIIPEPDLYRLIIKSRMPEAEMFEKWVMEKVLPTIRKTGRYVHNEMPKFDTIEDKTEYLSFFSAR